MAGYEQITLAQLRTRLQNRYESVPFWSTAEANAALNEALCTWGMLTGRWKERGVGVTVKDTYEVSLPSTMVYGMRVLFNGYPLSPSNLFDLNHGQPNWRAETTASGGGVPTRPTVWVPISLTLIYVWPADAVGHNGWTFDGVSATPILTNDAQYVNLPEADLSVLLGFALHVLTLKKGGQWFAATHKYLREFLLAAVRENSIISTAQFYRKFMGDYARSFDPTMIVPSPVSTLIPQGDGQ
jgi:hypothetical protein